MTGELGPEQQRADYLTALQVMDEVLAPHRQKTIAEMGQLVVSEFEDITFYYGEVLPDEILDDADEATFNSGVLEPMLAVDFAEQVKAHAAEVTEAGEDLNDGDEPADEELIGEVYQFLEMKELTVEIYRQMHLNGSLGPYVVQRLEGMSPEELAALERNILAEEIPDLDDSIDHRFED